MQVCFIIKEMVVICYAIFRKRASKQRAFWETFLPLYKEKSFLYVTHCFNEAFFPRLFSLLDFGLLALPFFISTTAQIEA